MSEQIEHLWDQYQDQVREQARYVFETLVKPFCEARGLRFVSKGEGCWVIPPESGVWRYSQEDDDEWQDIVHDLLEKVPGMNCRLCSLMPDYEPEANDESS